MCRLAGKRDVIKTGMRIGRGCVGVAIAAVLAMPVAASAGTVTRTGHRLEVNTYKGGNRLLIERPATRRAQLSITERNRDYPLRSVGRGCTNGPIEHRQTRVLCAAAGIRKITVSTRAGPDRVGVGWMPEQLGQRNCNSRKAIGASLNVSTGASRDAAELSDNADVLRGGKGADLLMGCGHSDRIMGGPGADDLSGDRGNDHLRGQEGGDDIFGCIYTPELTYMPRGEYGDDALRGGKGDDFLLGCGGRDRFRAGSGSDSLNTGDYAGRGPGEPVRCGAGEDIVFRDPGDSLRGCEVVTKCLTDIWPMDCSPTRPVLGEARDKRTTGPASSGAS